MMKIQKLPVEAISKLQSGIVVTDAVQCVMELVKNSLDAEATGVAVRIDLKNYQIKVIDNGRGVGKDDLELVGERFMTSKYHSLQNMEFSVPTYGYSGQALSSLQNVSRTLTIETKPEDGGPTFVKVFQNGRAQPIREKDSERNGTGTAVTIEDFMYAMPVRRKRVNEVFDMEEIKSQLQYLAIIHYGVCFTLRNESKGVILLQTPQTSSILESIRNIYGKSIANSLKALHYKDKEYEVTGFLSVKSQTPSNLQLVYINRRIITKGVIHKFMNNLLKQYSGKESLRTESPAGQVIKSLKISPNNVFIILITCPHLLCELFTNIRKTTVVFKNWTDVLKCVHRAVRGALKNVSNLSTSYTEGDKNNEGDNKEKRAFGTSLLLNAVRGAPVKRGLTCIRDSKKRKKLKVNKNLESFSRNENMEINTENHKENTNDSLESPIPKKKLRDINTGHDSGFKKCRDINQSFVEFYEWLKTNFESNTSAFMLYNDFLQFKNRTKRQNSNQKISEFKSPILGGKLKRKKTAGLREKNVERTERKVLGSFSTADYETAIAAQNQLNIFPSSQLRVKKGVQFTTDIITDFPDFLKVDVFRGEDLNFEKYIGQYSSELKAEKVSVLNRNGRQVEYNHTVSSLPSSEVRFTNIIKFRNLSESFLRQAPDTQVEVPAEKTCGSPASNTWLSHYQDVVSKNVGPLGEKNYFYRQDAPELPQKNYGLEKLPNFFGERLNFVEFANKTKEAVTLRDVEVQVEILKVVPAQRVDVMVQTFQAVPESPSFENSFVFGQETHLAATVIGNEGPHGCESVEKILNQEVPNPDFWNTSEYMKLERLANSEFVSETDEIISKTRNMKNEKNSTSVEFICGHKSHTSSKPQNDGITSKETQTVAAVWTDSLTQIGYPLENGRNTDDPDLNKSKLKDSELPKTFPNEEVERNISQHTEPGFCLTERYDIIPKGLSPEFINSETNKISMLNPREKYKIKLTIDNAQNETLANIKWQDESTGDCLKPKIPDGIFFEMNRRAEETAMNYGDQVLSATLSYCAVKVHNLLHSFTFTKELLSDVEILGQLDKKFIATKIKISAPKKMELLSLFDQHAVDERIKLEELINENISPAGNFTSSQLNPPVECKLAESEVRVASEFTEKILSFGLCIEPVNRNTLLITQAPSFLLTKHEKDLKNKKETSLSDVLKCLIVNILEEVTETRGAGSKTPKVLHNAFCLEACHKAIKFNKALSVDEMTEMINKLQNCTLPFQCAHGRPSVIPIIDLEDFKPSVISTSAADIRSVSNFSFGSFYRQLLFLQIEEKENIDFQKLKKFLNQRKEDDLIQNSEA